MFWQSPQLRPYCGISTGKNQVTIVQYSKNNELVLSLGWALQEQIEKMSLKHIISFGSAALLYQIRSVKYETKCVYEISLLNKQELMYLYKEEAFWNPKLKTQFLNNHTQFISKQYFGQKRNEEEEYKKTQIVGELPLKDLSAQ